MMLLLGIHGRRRATNEILRGVFWWVSGFVPS
jgi:hypothetical protein